MQRVLLALSLAIGLAGPLRTPAQSVVPDALKTGWERTLLSPSDLPPARWLGNLDSGEDWCDPSLRGMSSSVMSPTLNGWPKASKNDPWSCKWEATIGYTRVRFRPTPFTANMNGLEGSVVYNRGRHIALEAEALSAFGSAVFAREQTRIVMVDGGVRLAIPKRWLMPYLHADAGAMHVLPQTAANSQWGFAAKAGAGVNFRLMKNLSLRTGADYLRTRLFSQSQSNLEAHIGLVLHF